MDRCISFAQVKENLASSFLLETKSVLTIDSHYISYDSNISDVPCALVMENVELRLLKVSVLPNRKESSF